MYVCMFVYFFLIFISIYSWDGGCYIRSVENIIAIMFGVVGKKLKPLIDRSSIKSDN